MGVSERQLIWLVIINFVFIIGYVLMGMALPSFWIGLMLIHLCPIYVQEP